MKKMLLVLLAIVLLPIVAMGNSQLQDFAPDPIPPLPILKVLPSHLWKVYVEMGFPFGTIERGKDRIAYRYITTSELELGQGFVTVLIRRGRTMQKLLIPNDRVLYIVQTEFFYGWDTEGGK